MFNIYILIYLKKNEHVWDVLKERITQTKTMKQVSSQNNHYNDHYNYNRWHNLLLEEKDIEKKNFFKKKKNIFLHSCSLSISLF